MIHLPIMPELTASLELWIISQIFGLACLIFVVIGFNIKRKSKTMLFLSFANLSLVIALSLLGNWVVVSIMSVAFVRNFAFYFIEKRNEAGNPVGNKVTFTLTLLAMVAVTVLTLLLWDWWLDLLLLASTLFINLAKWMKGIHLFRIACFIYDSLVIVNFVIFFNIIGIVTQIIILSSIILFYIRFFRNRIKTKTANLGTPMSTFQSPD